MSIWDVDSAKGSLTRYREVYIRISSARVHWSKSGYEVAMLVSRSMARQLEVAGYRCRSGQTVGEWQVADGTWHVVVGRRGEAVGWMVSFREQTHVGSHLPPPIPSCAPTCPPPIQQQQPTSTYQCITRSPETLHSRRCRSDQQPSSAATSSVLFLGVSTKIAVAKQIWRTMGREALSATRRHVLSDL
jgi:hypothetical protein